MSRLCRMSSAQSNRSASIHRSLPTRCLLYAKLQKSHVALQEFVTATLQRAGPPRRMSFNMSHVFMTVAAMYVSSPIELITIYGLLRLRDSQQCAAAYRHAQ